VLSSASISKVNAVIQLAKRKRKRFHFSHSANAFHKFRVCFSYVLTPAPVPAAAATPASGPCPVASSAASACHLKSQSFRHFFFISVQTVGVAMGAQRHKWSVTIVLAPTAIAGVPSMQMREKALKDFSGINVPSTLHPTQSCSQFSICIAIRLLSFSTLF